MPIPLIIWGASGHAAVVAEAVRASGVYTVVGFIDDDDSRTGAAYFGSTILGTRETLAWLSLQGHRHIIFGFGDCAARRDLATLIAELGFTATTIVHPTATISPSAVLEPGVFVAAGAIIGARARVGVHTIVNTGAIIDHDCEIAAAVHVAPGVKLAGGVRVGTAAWVGLGASVLEKRSIGAEAVIGAGAVVVKDIPPRAVAYGVPTTVHRYLPPRESIHASGSRFLTDTSPREQAKVDLFLGSDIGLWALREVDPTSVARVITFDDAIADHAAALGLTVHRENANAIDYPTASIGYSVHYPRILKPPLLARYDVVYNLHPGYLPWGKGYYPVFWALWEESPAGPTLHEINAGIDDGPIVDQTLVNYSDSDTGFTLFDRVREAERLLFRKHWPAMARGERLPVRRQPDGGTYHNKREFLELKAAAGWESWPAERLIRLIRCLTVPQYIGWEVRLGDRRFEVKLSPLEE